MKPLEIDHVEAFLVRTFSAKGVLPDVTTLTSRDKVVNFLSKALAAFALQIYAKVTSDGAAASVTDGEADNGIDAFYFDSKTHILWCVQSKFIQDGSGQPDLKDVSLFPGGVRSLLKMDLERFNEHFQGRKLEIEQALADAQLKVNLVLIDTGMDFADDRVTLFEDLKRQFNTVDNTDFLMFEHCNLGLIHEEITETFARSPINVTLTLQQWGMVNTPYKSCYGQIAASKLAELYATHQEKLVERNIRNFRGLTVVNERIAETIAKSPADFFYLNNGVTAVCRKLDILPVSRDNRSAGQFKIEDLSIVNGAQTVGTIANQFGKAAPASDPLVFIKIISLEEGREGLGDQITRSTNFQNRVERVDFVALDPEQERLRRALELSGINYHFKKDDESIERDNKNFFVEEATVALACLGPVSNVVPLKRDMGDFWDLENKEKSNYRRLFNSGLSARTMWRGVQIARRVFAVVDSRYRAETKPERYKCYKHAKYLILHIVFIKSGLAHKSELELTPEQMTELSQTIDLVAETVCNEGVSMFPYKEFYNVFKNITDCTNLKNKVMAKLAPPPAVAVPAANPAAAVAPIPASPPPLPPKPTAAAPVATPVLATPTTTAVSPTPPPSATT
jgi:hypothetical protein